ncbi:MAG: aminoacyl-tRNA hydrolase [Candidatus Melainabacteria bacterium RIFCSPLOWO2_02_FULL_35_15]|nr:MAG: aminoacyl-tRNA hydrolase [Candidatus Melainabacteria bacterium RIFCSPLOWO2_12_FULL_35_11]OGI13593.1 MAG: aminoacyl-tRNA hydrolase [Candidatus Melainabacteria bacterium RIFCSPLOWO2_02_FULL_35_15]
MPIKKLIIALGNPGNEYENTRHNVGFAVLDAFGEKYKILGKEEKKLLSWCGKEKIEIEKENHEIILAWPTTFMNHSGDAVIKLLNWFKLESSDLIVVHDDVALNLGKIRINFNSGAGGHHGIESIIRMLGGNQEFTRLRIGIGPDPGGDIRADYVLRKFSKEEESLLGKVTELSISALEAIITKDVGEAMNKFNGIEILS